MNTRDHIASIHINNFRCFDDHRIELVPASVLVGKNNAGKSTCIEALRIVSLATERLHGLSTRLRPPPQWCQIPQSYKGFSPSLADTNISTHPQNSFHRYGDPPAIIDLTFSSGRKLTIWVGPNFALHIVLRDASGSPINSTIDIQRLRFPKVSVLPPIRPIEENEVRLTSDYIRTKSQTSLSSRHFRNHLLNNPVAFDVFAAYIRKHWNGVDVKKPESSSSAEDPIALFVRDGNFTAEVAWMGHGLQMWMQIMWFIAKNADSDVLVMDEPDVYMHADLQRRLIRLLLAEKRNFILATHSTEMLAEVDADSERV